MDLAILILRVSVGLVMIPHGLQKFTGRARFDKMWKEDYGFPVGTVLLVGIVHLFGGLAIIAGIFTQIISVIILITMLVATYLCIWVHHEPLAKSPDGKGWDINLMLIGTLIALIILGDGAWSLAAWLM